MATKISRRKLANWSAKRLASGDPAKNVMHELGAYLIDTRRTHEQSLIIRDIEIALLSEGSVLVNAVAARPLSDEAKSDIQAFVKSEYGSNASVIIHETIDESVIGGVKLETPDKQIDATVRNKLEKLMA